MVYRVIFFSNKSDPDRYNAFFQKHWERYHDFIGNKAGKADPPTKG